MLLQYWTSFNLTVIYYCSHNSELVQCNVLNGGLPFPHISFLKVVQHMYNYNIIRFLLLTSLSDLSVLSIKKKNFYNKVHQMSNVFSNLYHWITADIKLYIGEGLSLTWIVLLISIGYTPSLPVIKKLWKSSFCRIGNGTIMTAWPPQRACAAVVLLICLGSCWGKHRWILNSAQIVSVFTYEEDAAQLI